MRKQIIILAMILAALIALLLVVLGVRRLTGPKYPELKFDPAKVTGISITSPKSGMTLLKEKDGWKVRDNTSGKIYTADPGAAASVIENISRMSVTDIVSNNPARHAEFQVEESSGIKVEIKIKGKKDISFILGKESYDYGHYYFRFAGTAQVRLASGMRKASIDRPVDSWRDTRILRLDRGGVTRMEVNYPGNPKKDIVLALAPGTTGQWLAENVLDGAGQTGGKPKKADFDEVVKPLLYIITDFMHNGFAPAERKWGKTLFTVTVTAKEGVFKFMVGDKMVENRQLYYFGKKENEDTIYKIIDYKIENIRRERSDIK